jgi:hypothetical protein
MARLMKEIKNWSNIYFIGWSVSRISMRSIDTHQYLQLDEERQFDTPQVTAHGMKQSCKAWRIVVVGGGGVAVVVLLLLLLLLLLLRGGSALTNIPPYMGDLKCERGEHGNRGSPVGCMEVYGIRGVWNRTF